MVAAKMINEIVFDVVDQILQMYPNGLLKFFKFVLVLIQRFTNLYQRVDIEQNNIC